MLLVKDLRKALKGVSGNAVVAIKGKHGSLYFDYDARVIDKGTIECWIGGIADELGADKVAVPNLWHDDDGLACGKTADIFVLPDTVRR